MRRRPLTIKEWREKHPRCKYCVHAYYSTYILSEKRAWCRAKMKNVNDETPRYFCRLYKTEE